MICGKHGKVTWLYSVPESIQPLIGQTKVQLSFTEENETRVKRLAGIFQELANDLFKYMGDEQESLNSKETTALLWWLRETLEDVSDWNKLKQKCQRARQEAVSDPFSNLIRDITPTGIEPSPATVQALRTHVYGMLRVLSDSLGSSPTGPQRAFGTPTNPSNMVSDDHRQPIMLSELISEFLLEKSRHSPNKQHRSLKGALSLLQEYVGDKPASLISRPEISAFRKALLTVPTNRKKRFPGISLHEIIAQNPKPPLLSVASADSYIAVVGSLFGWGVKQGYLETNRATGLRYEHRARLDQERYVLANTDLKTIFEQSPLYTGCSHKRWRARPGSLVIRDGYFWIPLVALYGGLRLTEIAGLRTKDVYESAGRKCFYVREYEGHRVKNRWAVRMVPIHPVLMQRGFEDYLNSISSEPEATL